MPLLLPQSSRIRFLSIFHPTNGKISTKLVTVVGAPSSVAMRASYCNTPPSSSAATTPSSSHEGHNCKQAELYHQQTKHHLNRYARGPGGLDWANQPNPFLRYVSAPLLPLLHLPPSPGDFPTYASLFSSPTFPLPPQRLDLSSLSRLLYDSLALSAWKSTSYSTWSLRVNPSSGNLHPTEAYVVAPSLPSPQNGDAGAPSAFFSSPFVAHYAPKEHALELRSSVPTDIFECILPQGSSFLVGLSSIFWREAWKYGERAFRYCNHDVGHAIAAVSIAAAALGWDVRLLDGFGQSDLSNLLGIGFGFPAPEREVPSRPCRGHFPWMELEHADCALAVFPPAATLSEGMFANYAQMSSEVAKLKSLQWFGKPNSLSKSHVCWDIIYSTADAVTKPLSSTHSISVNPLQSGGLLSEGIYKDFTVREVVRKRRSAVDMDGIHVMERQTFYQILMHCLPSGYSDSGKQGRQLALPFRVLPWDSEVHAVLFVHRVDGLPNGVYFMVRNEDHFDSLKQAMRSEFEWEKPDGCPAGLPLYRLLKGDCKELSKQVSCHQDIASDGCFSLGMVARFSPVLREKGAWMYPRLFWESGVLGQVLYLEAHAVGISATGIGCYFDDTVHGILGLGGTEFQSLYHFTVGSPVVDKRIMSLPAYPGPTADA